MSGFVDVYQRLCDRYPDERDRGRAFEPLVTKVLRTDPLYRAHFAEVWPWSEWPGARWRRHWYRHRSQASRRGLGCYPVQMPGSRRQAPHQLIPV